VRPAEALGAIVIVCGLACATGAAAAVCPVPSAGHPTIDSAVRDPVCTSVALGAATLAESVVIERDLEIQGGGAAISVVAGSVRASGAGTSVTLASLAVDGSAPGVAGCGAAAVEASGGAEIAAGSEVEVLAADGAGPCRIFADGFASGSTLAWTSAVP
jgi:hypothetical protein